MLDRIERSAARVISVILHPMLLSTYAIVILFNLPAYFSLMIPVHAKWMIGVFVLIITGLLPLFLTFIMSKTGIIRNIILQEREERIWPFLITALFYYLAYYLLNRLELSPVYTLFMLGAFISVVAGLMISFFWKISAHMIGMGGLVGAFTGLSVTLIIDMPLLIVLLILLSGFTGFARLKLTAHSPAQILSGFLTGFVILFLIFLQS